MLISNLLKNCKNVHLKKVMGRKLFHTVKKLKDSFFHHCFVDNFSRRKRHTKPKNVLYEHVLELNFSTINSLGQSSFQNRFTLMYNFCIRAKHEMTQLLIFSILIKICNP
jgi:hypothetical protein